MVEGAGAGAKIFSNLLTIILPSEKKLEPDDSEELFFFSCIKFLCSTFVFSALSGELEKGARPRFFDILSFSFSSSEDEEELEDS